MYAPVIVTAQRPSPRGGLSATKLHIGHLPVTVTAQGPSRGQSASKLHIGAVCLLLALEALLLLGGQAIVFQADLARPPGTWCTTSPDEEEELHAKIQGLRHSVNALAKEEARLTGLSNAGAAQQQQPELYGRIREKTIWSYWYHRESCPSSKNCTLPPHLQLCRETISRNRGSFDYRLLHPDDVARYVSPVELPRRWRDLGPAQQKDALMNALLARYGGVALDISMILLGPLDEYWAEMVAKGASFRGYMYRLNGRPWRHHESMAVWFLMSRKEGIFSTAVRDQVIYMGDQADTGTAYRDWYLAFGDQTLLPIVSKYNYSLPKCFNDYMVREQRKCPEYQQPPWYEATTGPALNAAQLLLEDPRDGPQLPFAWLGMETWHARDEEVRTAQEGWSDNGVGAPMHGTNCTSMRECWEAEFLPRLAGRHLRFVKLFDHGRGLEGRTREALLADKDSYFAKWLRLAGLPAAAGEATPSV